MPLISISKADLAKGIPLSTGWKEFEIKDVQVKPAKSDPNSVNYVFTFALSNDPEGKELDVYFSSKAPGRMAPLIAALDGRGIQEILADMKNDSLNFNTDNALNKHVMGKVDHEDYQGRIMSRIVDFATVGKVPF